MPSASGELAGRAHPVATGVLGRVQGSVGGAEQRHGIAGIAGKDRHAAAGGDGPIDPGTRTAAIAVRIACATCTAPAVSVDGSRTRNSSPP